MHFFYVGPIVRIKLSNWTNGDDVLWRATRARLFLPIHSELLINICKRSHSFSQSPLHTSTLHQIPRPFLPCCGQEGAAPRVPLFLWSALMDSLQNPSRRISSLSSSTGYSAELQILSRVCLELSEFRDDLYIICRKSLMLNFLASDYHSYCGTATFMLEIEKSYRRAAFSNAR